MGEQKRDTASPQPREQSAAALSPFPPIADYTFHSNSHTGAHVAPDGGIGWLCIPRGTRGPDTSSSAVR